MKKLKSIRKVFALVLAAAMMMVVAMPAMLALADETTTKGSITIENALPNSEYTAYKIFDVTYSSTETPAPTNAPHTYTISQSSAWFAYVVDYAKYGANSSSDTYSTLAPGSTPGTTIAPESNSGSGLCLTKTTATSDIWNVEVDTNFSAQNFAAYLKSHIPTELESSGTVTATAKPDDGKTYSTETINVKDAPGYYFVTTSLGALCLLDTADPTVTINEKNSFPTISKAAVTGNSGYSASYDSNAKSYTVNTPAPDNSKVSASVGDTVSYEIIVQAGKGATGDYYIQDYTKNSGLTPIASATPQPEGTVPQITSVQYYDSGSSSWKDFDDGSWSLLSTTDSDVSLTSGGSVATSVSGYTKLFTIRISNSAIKDFADGTPIRVQYTTTVTSSAITDSKAINVPVLVENVYDTTSSKPSGSNVAEKTNTAVSVKNYDFDIYKYTGESKALSGATFEIYSDAECKTQIKFASTTDSSNSTSTTYYYPDANGSATLTSGTDGLIHIRGLAGKTSGSDKQGTTYYIKEIEAPAGYNLLTGVESVTLTDADQLYSSTAKDNKAKSIKNNTGSEIPSTGGIGTVIFYVVGAMLLVGAGVLLITRRKTGAR